jgi:hypothetical protein
VRIRVNVIPKCGVIISDLSDHFFTLVQLPICRKSKPPVSFESRNFSKNNIKNFKESLSALEWNDVLATNDVNSSFDKFWENFKLLFDLHFPLRKTKFNKNLHKIHGFMTEGLLTSRKTKIFLHKKSLNSPSPENVNKFKCYRNRYRIA